MSLYSIPTLLGAISVLVIGVFVFKQNKRSMVNVSFALFCFSVFVWLFSYTVSYSTTDFETAVFFTTLACTAVIFTAPTFYHFSLEHLGFYHLRKTIIIPYAIMIILTPIFFKTTYLLDKPHKAYWGYYSTAGPFHPVYLLIHFSIVGFVFFLLLKKYYKGQSLTLLERQRLKYTFCSDLLVSLSAIDFLQKYGATFYPFGFVFVVAFVVVTAYAILRYRLLDVYLVIKRTAAYSLSAGLLTAFFTILVLTVTNLLSSYANVSSLKISIFAALVIAIMFNPLRNRIQSLIDKVFYKKTYDYYATIEKVTRELESIFELERIYNLAGEIIYSTLGLNNIYVLAAGSAGGSYGAVYHSSKKDKGKKEKQGQAPKRESEEKIEALSNDSKLIKLLKKSNSIIVKDELSTLGKDDDVENIEVVKNDFKMFDGEAAVPVSVDRKIVLVLILGRKLSGDMYTTEDINLLNTIANQTAIAIKNAGLYKEKVNAERLASIGMMSATFAHEVRNPLTSLKTFAQLMPEKYNDVEFRETFSRIVVGEIERIDGLIGDLLDFSSDKKLSRVNYFNLTSLVDEIVDYVRGKIEFERKSIYFEKNYGKEEINMTGDAEKLKQAFINIITNGCQAMNGEGTLTVSMKQNGKYAEIAITDTGEGISESDISKIFDPFVTTKDMGIGLGLAISKRIIEDHQGKINVRSRVLEGTTFTIILPVQND